MTPETGTPLPALSNHKTLFQILAVIFLLFGAYMTVLFVVFTVASHGMAFRAAGSGMFSGALGDVFFLVNGVCSLLAGFGLITRKPWGRFAAILASAVALFIPIIGTIPAIIILILLFTAGSKRHYAAYCATA
jgi:hypothetical protein